MTADCRVYANKRFCIKSVKFNTNEFPKDVKSRIVKHAGAAEQLQPRTNTDNYSFDNIPAVFRV